jgi:hypothetical protein
VLSACVCSTLSGRRAARCARVRMRPPSHSYVHVSHPGPTRRSATYNPAVKVKQERGPRGVPDALPSQPSLDEVLPGGAEVRVTRSRLATAPASCGASGGAAEMQDAIEEAARLRFAPLALSTLHVGRRC